MKLYLAAPLFTIGEQVQNAQLADQLRRFGYECFVPQEAEANPRADVQRTAKSIFLADVTGVDNCDVVVACIDGPDPDSGTAWELGYAYALGKPTVLYRTDFRSACGDFDGQPVNLMLSVPAKATVVWNGRITDGLMRVRQLAALLHAELRLIAP